MTNNNLKINNNSLVHSQASTTKVINIGKVSPKNYARFNTIVTTGWSGDDGAGGEDDVDDDDPDEVYLDDGVDGDDLPSSGRNFPAEICLPESSFSLGVFRPAEAAESFYG